MFTRRYFPDRYFAPRYFPKEGATVETTGPFCFTKIRSYQPGPYDSDYYESGPLASRTYQPGPVNTDDGC